MNPLKLVVLSVFLIAFSAHPAERTARPNILFVIADDWGRHAGVYGTKWIRTPGFDRVAKEGLLFTQAFTPNAKCAPSRAILLTGRHSWQLEEAGNHMAYFPAKFKSFPEALREHGYSVGSTGKGWGPGVANDANGKPREICGKQFNQRKSSPPTKAISNNDYASNFVDFLDAIPDRSPWCFWFGATEPHRGYELGSGEARGGKALSDIERVPGYWPDHPTVRRDMLDYAFEVEHMDRHLVRMLTELEKRGQLDQTIIICTSDHGMPFPRVKGQAYLDANRIPLAVRWPAGIQKPGRVIDDFVDFTDVAPTVLDVAGVAWPDTAMAPATGRSWRPIFQSDKQGRVVPERDHVLVGKERHDVGRPHDWGYPIRGLIKDNFLYLRNFEPSRWPSGNPETGYLNCDGSPTKTFILETHRRNRADPFWALSFGKRPSEELYDLARDPDCIHNLAADSAHQSRRSRMEAEMRDKLTAQGDPRMFGKGDVFDRYPISTEAIRNFYERIQRGEKIRAGWVNESDFEKEPLD